MKTPPLLASEQIVDLYRNYVTQDVALGNVWSVVYEKIPATNAVHWGEG